VGEQIPITKKRIMLIGYDAPRESAYHLHRKKKEMHRDNLIELCSKVIEIKDKAEFIKNPRKYVIEEYKQASGLKQVKEEEFLKLVDLPINEINKTFEAYSTYSSVDLDAPIPNFEIHTTNKAQEDAYKRILKLCDALNQYSDKITPQLQYVLNTDVILTEGKWYPNPYRIMLF
jgi:hypothetical protein